MEIDVKTVAAFSAAAINSALGVVVPSKTILVRENTNWQEYVPSLSSKCAYIAAQIK